MSPSETEKFPLEVIADDMATELYVIDGNFQVVDRGVGRTTFELPRGIYKVKACSGKVQSETLVTVRGPSPAPLYIAPLAFASPIPLANTAQTHEFHMAAAGSAMTNVHATHGQGSAIIIVVRRWTSDQAGQAPGTFPDPSRGLRLRTMSGDLLADIEQAAEKNLNDEPWAICHVALDPGAYRLALELPDGRRLEQTLIAARDWQTRVFLLAGEDRADISGAAISMRKAGSPFDIQDPDARLEELAREAIGQNRKILSLELRMRLQQPDVPPVLGILGMHLLIREAKRNKLSREQNPDEPIDAVDNVGPVQSIIANLRASIGKHPDVEAIAIGAGVADSTYAFDVPPMLRLSWRLLLKASADQPALVPCGSLIDEAAKRLWGDGPWFLWIDPATDPVSDRDASWRQRAIRMITLLEDLPSTTTEETPLPPAAAEAIPKAPATGTLQSLINLFVAKHPQHKNVTRILEKVKAAAEGGVIEGQRILMRLNPERRRNLVKQLGVPMATIDAWLDEIVKR
jgi:hypothetical protein